MDGDFFVSTDAKGADGVPGFGGHGCLTGELFQDFRGTGQAITRFTDANVCSRVQCVNASVRVGHGKGDENILMTSFSMRSSFMGLVGVVFCSAWLEGSVCEHETWTG